MKYIKKTLVPKTSLSEPLSVLAQLISSSSSTADRFRSAAGAVEAEAAGAAGAARSTVLTEAREEMLRRELNPCGLRILIWRGKKSESNTFYPI